MQHVRCYINYAMCTAEGPPACYYKVQGSIPPSPTFHPRSGCVRRGVAEVTSGEVKS